MNRPDSEGNESSSSGEGKQRRERRWEKTCSDVEVNSYDLVGAGKVQKSEEKESRGDANLRRGTERRRRRNVRPWKGKA